MWLISWLGGGEYGFSFGLFPKFSWLGGEYGSQFSQFISKAKLHLKTLISWLGGQYGHFDQLAGGGVDGDLQKVKVVYLVKSGLF